MRFLLIAAIICILASCQSLQQSAKYQFSDGFYKTYGVRGRGQRFYVAKLGDTLMLSDSAGRGPYSPQPEVILLKEDLIGQQRPPKRVFTKASFDLDLLTIPVRFRPTRPDVPAQLNYSFSGVLYLGRRVDRYSITYSATPLGFHRQISHYGFSFGPVVGLSSVFISPTNTAFRQNQEYDGLALTGGLAAILGVNGLSFGLIAGLDHLPDRNGGIWLYQNRPWLGLGLGLNLN